MHLRGTNVVPFHRPCVREHGHVVIDELISAKVMDRIEAELQPYFDGTPFGHLSELGFKTQRTGSLLARSPTVRELVMQEIYLSATRVVSGSHTAGVGARFSDEDSLPVEMKRGSVLIFSGKLYHSGGANRSGRIRRVIDIGFSVGWVRQVENQ